MEITLKQYQDIYLIPTGLTNQTYTKKMLEIFNIDGNKYTSKEIKKLIEDIHIPELKDLNKLNIKIDGKKYRIAKDIMSSSFNEWIQYESIVGVSSNDNDIVRNLHKILAIYVRPEKRKFLFFKTITPIEDTDMDSNEKEMLKLKIEDALAINVFFYHNAQSFMNSIRRRYLNEQIRLTPRPVHTPTKLKLLTKVSAGISYSWKYLTMTYLKLIQYLKLNFKKW